jgi:hypothetical protein
MSRVAQRCRIESCRPRVVVALVILILLAFTTIRTSPISAHVGSGSSLSATTPKQRQFSASELSWAIPVLVQTAVASREYGDVVPERFDDLPRPYFFTRCSDLPPPTA